MHAEALSRRTEWFERGPWPAYVAWWVHAEHLPRWNEASDRIDHLHSHGPTPHAFTFREPFDAAGAKVALDRKRMMAPARGD